MQANIWNISGWIETTEPDALKKQFDRMLKECGFGILSFQEHHFKPHGYSALWLLSESHFGIHTFPEECTCYYELSSCVERQFKKFLHLMDIGETPRTFRSSPALDASKSYQSL